MIPMQLVNIHVDISQNLVVLVTLSAAFVFGLVVLPRPNSATIAWGIAFGVGLLGTYSWVAATQMDLVPMRAAASSLMLCFVPLIWLGLRLFAKRRVPWIETILFVIVAPVVLGFTAGTELFTVTFRAIFAIGAVFACMIAIDLARLSLPSRDIVMPLLLASCAYIVVAIFGFVSQLLEPAMSSAEQLSVLRDINGIGTLVIGYCAAVTIVLLVRTQQPGRRPQNTDDITFMRARLARAEAQNDAAWSVLDIRLDDTRELREASSQGTFLATVESFHQRVADALPASADLLRISGGRVVVLIPGSEGAVEATLRSVLGRVSRMDDDSFRLSASIGWVTALDGRFDCDVLAELAAEGAERAQAGGGDCWERVRRSVRTR